MTAPRVDRRLSPLFHPSEAGSPERASMLSLRAVPTSVARRCIAAWHSRLPVTQRGPWILAHAAVFEETVFAVALWHNPSARTLPSDWLELRRMAVAPDAPHCTASWMLAAMKRDIEVRMPTVSHLISYQDEEVHTGTIYRAAGWVPESRGEARVRDRSSLRPSGRSYRSSINGAAPDVAAKTRWATDIPTALRTGAPA